MKNLVEEIRERIDPVITKANNLLITVNEMAETVQDKTEHIAGSAAHTTDVIGARMERTSGFMQQMVASPIIRGIAFTEGLGAGIATWRKLRRSRKA